jgi:hypothetical protein
VGAVSLWPKSFWNSPPCRMLMLGQEAKNLHIAMYVLKRLGKKAMKKEANILSSFVILK